MEQVQRTIPELSSNGFREIEMCEVLTRPLEVEEIAVNSLTVTKLGQKRELDRTQLVAKHKSEIKGHTSYLYFATLLPPPIPIESQ